MKNKLSYIALFSVLMLQACGGGGLAGDEKDSTDPLVPDPVVDDGSDKPRPSANAPHMKTDGVFLKDMSGNNVWLRGIDVTYASAPLDKIKNIAAVKDAGSNVVRLEISKTTRDIELEGALVDILDRGMLALVTLVDDSLTCKDDADALDDAVKKLWLDKWLSVIAQDRFQPILMINVAHQWGPQVFTENTVGYGDYMEAHKLAIRDIRKAGIKVPLVIDASGCGQDYFSFTAGRARELKAADSEANLVLSLHAFGETWSTDDKVRSALTALTTKTNTPFILSGFGDQGIEDFDVDPQTIMKRGVGDGGLSFNIPWAATDDKAAYSMNLEEPAYLKGGSVRVDVFVPKAYTDDGKLGLVLYLKDASGKYANTGWNQVSNMAFDSWNRINSKLISVEELVAAGAYVEEGFDLGSVSKIGIELIANGKAVGVKAPLVFDNLTVFPGIPPVYQANFDSTNQEWEVHWGSFTSTAAGGNLTITPTTGESAIDLQGWKAPTLYEIPLSKKLDVTLKVFLPESYAVQTGMTVKLFGQFGNDWSVWRETGTKGLADFIIGGWTEIKYSVDFSDAITPQAFGMVWNGFSGAQTEPILIDWIKIEDPSKKNTKVITAQQLGTTFNSGLDAWSVIWDKQASAVLVDGVLEITNTNTSGAADVAVGKTDIANKELNLRGPITLKLKLFVPESFRDTDFYFQMFMQDNTWNNNFEWRWDSSTLNYGEWNTLEWTRDDFPSVFVRTANLKNFVIQFGGNVTGTIKVDDIQIWGDVEVEDAQPLWVMGFETETETNKFAFDYAQGSLTEGVLATAKYFGVATLPYGWIAPYWKAESPLDLSESDTAVDLTERGEEIVNGEYGIKNTSIPASVPAD